MMRSRSHRIPSCPAHRAPTSSIRRRSLCQRRSSIPTAHPRAAACLGRRRPLQMGQLRGSPHLRTTSRPSISSIWARSLMLSRQTCARPCTSNPSSCHPTVELPRPTSHAMAAPAWRLSRAGYRHRSSRPFPRTDCARCHGFRSSCLVHRLSPSLSLSHSAGLARPTCTRLKYHCISIDGTDVKRLYSPCISTL